MNKKLLLLSLAILLMPMAVFAAIHIKVNAPRSVATGEDFRIEYYVSTRDVENFTGPDFPVAVSVLYGPSRSEMSSYQVINGKSSGSSSVTFTYTCSIDKAGTVTIPPATIKISGKTYRTNSVTIRASGASRQGNASSARGGAGGGQSNPASTGGKITAKDLFITVSANKTRVYEQEPVVLTYKIYTRVNLTQMTGKMPDLKGFLIQEVPLPRNKTFGVEQYNGENYQSTKWCQYVMFPQQTGKLTIPSIKFDGIIAVANPNIDPFDAFFNGNSNFAEVKKSIVAPSIAINVSKLPSPKPSGFSGAVGKFHIASTIPAKSIRTNENMPVRVTITGVGNMKLITAPKLNLGADFEVFPPKIDDKTTLTADGMSGAINYNYVVVPHQKGNYTLPAIKFVFFNTSSNTYDTVTTSPVAFRVEQGAAQPSPDDELLRRDINDIHRGSYSTPSRFFSLSNVWYFALMVAELLLFFVCFMVLKRSERFKDNTTLRLQRGARRKAVKQLRKAERLMKAGDNAAFYDELAGALLSYTTHRLSISMSDFKTEELSAELQKRGVSQALADEIVGVMKDCEFARFAPGNPQENMEELYERAVKDIVEIEKSLRK